LREEETNTEYAESAEGTEKKEWKVESGKWKVES
jgi:hypothetical protein